MKFKGRLKPPTMNQIRGRTKGNDYSGETQAKDAAMEDIKGATNDFVAGGPAKYEKGTDLTHTDLSPAEQLQWQSLSPAEKQAQSGMSDISTDPKYKEHEMAALRELEDQSQNGFTARDKADMARTENQVNRANKGRLGAIQQNMQARGMSGSGMDLVAQMQSSQDANEIAAMKALEQEGMMQDRKSNATMNLGQMSSQLQSRDFGQDAQKAQAQDAINRFNTQNSNDNARYNNQGQNSTAQNNWQQTNDDNRYNNAGQNNTAQANWGRANSTADRNSGAQYDYNKDVMGAKTAQATQAYDVAQYGENMRRQQEEERKRKRSGQVGAVLGTAGAVVGGIYGGPAGAAAGSALGSGIGQAVAAHGGRVEDPNEVTIPGEGLRHGFHGQNEGHSDERHPTQAPAGDTIKVDGKVLKWNGYDYVPALYNGGSPYDVPNLGYDDRPSNDNWGLPNPTNRGASGNHGASGSWGLPNPTNHGASGSWESGHGSTGSWESGHGSTGSWEEDDPRRDNIPVMLSPEEVVLPRSVARSPKKAAQFVDNLNKNPQNDSISERNNPNVGREPDFTNMNPDVLNHLAKTNPSLVEAYRKKMADADGKVKDAKDMAKWGSFADTAGNLLTDYNNSQKSDVILGNSLSQIAAGHKNDRISAEKSNWNSVAPMFDKKVSEAENDRSRDEDAFNKETQLGVMDRANAKEAKSNDPSSAESASAREFLKTVAPEATKMAGFDNLTEAQAYKVAGPMFDKYKADTADKAADRRMKMQVDALKAKSSGQDSGMSKGEVAVDKAYSKDYNTYIGQGRTNAQASITRLEAIQKQLESESKKTIQSGGGTISNALPDYMRTQSSIELRDNSITAANATLKGLFGGQLSDGERVAAANEFYNDKLDAKANAALMKKKIQQMKNAAANEDAKAAYFQENGSLSGYVGNQAKAPPTGMVKIISPNGKPKMIPPSQVDAAVEAGGKVVD